MTRITNIITKDIKRPPTLDFKRQIGTTTYIVTAHFNDNAKIDMVSKVRSLILRAS